MIETMWGMLPDNLSSWFIQFVNVVYGIYDRFLGGQFCNLQSLNPSKRKCRLAECRSIRIKSLYGFVNK